MATQTTGATTAARSPRTGTRAASPTVTKSKNGAKPAGSSQTVRVDLAERSYDIRVERGILSRLGKEALKALSIKGDAGGRIAAVVVNPKVEHYHGKGIYESLKDAGFDVFPIVLVAGECYKNLQAARRIYGMLHDRMVDRRTVIFAVGGGVIGDVAGFVAATYLRGLDYIQVPTTLLAQVDSSVGGKVGVNYKNGKNLVGAFYQPRLVSIDPNTLNSLPFRERRSGLAEIIKYGAIADKEFFGSVSAEISGLLRLNSGYLETAIAHSCRIKAQVVEKDERDEGLRAILNFGHTVGHALEALTNYRVYRHGEAIAIGMVSACLIGEEMGVTHPSVTGAIKDVLIRAGFPIHFDERLYPNDAIRLMSLDKKAVGGEVRFVLLERLGRATTGHRVPEDIIRGALLRQRQL